MTTPLASPISEQFKTASIGGREVMLDGSNIGYHRDRIEAWERGEKIAPIFMDIAWTRKCQAACTFCYSMAQASTGGVITWEHAQHFLEDAAEIGVRAMNFISDGESTMVPWYADSVEKATDLGLAIGAGTNGIALNESVLERILPRLTFLRVNFSAGERKRYAEIMGLKQAVYDIVVGNLRNAVRLVRDNKWDCIVNLNLVCDPKDADQLIPFASIAKDIGVHYAIIKQCAVDPDGILKVDYKDYTRIEDTLKACEEMSDENTKIIIKWEKMKDEGIRKYNRCFGPPFALQMSGNGLITSCGPNFNEKYKALHIGNITTQRFRDIFASTRYWDVMKYLTSDEFNPQKRCATSCMQHLANDWLFRRFEGKVDFPIGPAPSNVNFLA